MMVLVIAHCEYCEGEAYLFAGNSSVMHWAQLEENRTVFPIISLQKSCLGAMSHVKITYQTDNSDNENGQVILALPNFYSSFSHNPL